MHRTAVLAIAEAESCEHCRPGCFCKCFWKMRAHHSKARKLAPLFFLMSSETQNPNNSHGYTDMNLKSTPSKNNKNKQALLFPSTILLHLVFIHCSDTEHGEKYCQVASTVHIILYHIFPHSPSLSLLFHQHYFLEDLPSAVLWPLPNSITVSRFCKTGRNSQKQRQLPSG